jgi:hypothetical protein
MRAVARLATSSTDNDLFILRGDNDRMDHSAAAAHQPERRRSNRVALRVAATMREGSQGKVRVRLIDISTHGCRIECTSTVAADSRVWLNIAGLESQNCRVVWHCQEFVGLEFEQPLAEAVLERLLEGQQQLPESRITELREIATRTHWLARQAGDSELHPLADLSKSCAVDAVVEGFRLGDSKRSGGNGKPKSPPA